MTRRVLLSASHAPDGYRLEPRLLLPSAFRDSGGKGKDWLQHGRVSVGDCQLSTMARTKHIGVHSDFHCPGIKLPALHISLPYYQRDHAASSQ